MTPDGVKSGSSIIQVSYTTQSAPLSPGGRHDSLWGEATYVDLGGGKNLFVTLGILDAAQHAERWYSPSYSLEEPSDYDRMKGPMDALWLPIKIFQFGRTVRKEREMCGRVDTKYAGPSEQIPLSNLPTLVTFSDMRQPNTAKVVDPNDLAATFGHGYSLSAKIEITAEKVTPKIYKVVPWTGATEPYPKELYNAQGQEINRLTRQEFYKVDGLSLGAIAN